MLGLDCTRYPSARAVLDAGYGFVWGYLSTPGNPKNITPAKVAEYAAAGIGVPTIFETTAARAGQGYGAGVADARSAVVQQANLVIPASRPIHYAVDYDATGPAVGPYFDGLAAVPGEDSAYGGIKVVSWLLDRGLIHDAWQTAAWSRGQIDPRIAVFQRIGTVYVDGIPCDVNESFVADFGQYPIQESDVNLDDVVGHTYDDPTGTYTVRQFITGTHQHAKEADRKAQALAVKVDALAGALSDDEANIIAAVRAQPTGGQVDVPALAAALASIGTLVARVPDDQMAKLLAEIDKMPASTRQVLAAALASGTP